MKRVIIVHGWQGEPGNHWKGWLRRELEKRGVEVVEPFMPNESNEPKDWISKLREVAGKVDQDTVIVGHSLGCPTAIGFLSELPNDKKVGGCILVAGFSSRLKDFDELSKFDFLNKYVKNAKRHSDHFVSIVSDNDESVPFEKSKELNDLIGGKLILEKGKGHFCEDDGVTELPSALDAILYIFNLPTSPKP